VVMHMVQSSNVDAVGYEGTTLRVQFRSGATYDYLDVPANVYSQLVGGQSPGSYLASFIKPNFEAKRVD